jgi:hypothetical protein
MLNHGNPHDFRGSPDRLGFLLRFGYNTMGCGRVLGVG